MADSIGSVGLVVSSDISQFQSDMGKAALIAEREMQRTAQATQIADRAAQRFIQSLKDEAATFGKSREEVLAYRAAQMGVTDQAQQYINTIAKQKAASANSGAKELASDLEHVGFQSAGAKRELLVLAHEISQGNWTRFGGSLMVIGERTNIMSLAFSGAGLAIMAAVGAVAGFVTLVIKGAMEQAAFNKSLIATNNYAGLTADGFNEVARSAAVATNATIGAAKQMEQAFVSTGRVGPGNLSLFEQTALLQEKATGQTTDEVVKDYARMTDGVTKWAEETNKQYHFLTLGQYEHIRALEEQGRMEDAERIVLQALQGQLTQTTTNLGYMQRGWISVKDAIGDALDAMKRWGQDSPVGDAQAALAFAKAQQQRAINMGGTGNAEQGAVTAAQDKLRMTQMEEFRKSERAGAQAQADADNQRAIKASDFLKNLREQTNEQAKLNKELTEYHAAIAAEAKVGHMTSPEQQAKDEAAIRAKYNRKGIGEQNKEDKANLEQRLQQIQDNLKAQEDALKYNDSVVKALYQSGEMSAANYYAELRRMAQLDLQDKLDSYAKDIKAQEDYIKNYSGPDKAAKVIAAQKAIQHAREQAAQAQQTAAQSVVLSNMQEEQSMRQLGDQVLSFQANMLQMQGDVAGAAALRASIAINNARKLAMQAGGPTSPGDFARMDRGQPTAGVDVSGFERLLEIDNQMTASKNSLTLLTEREKTAEDLYAITAKRNGTGLLQQERDIHAMRQAALDQMQQLVTSAEELANGADENSPIARFARQLRLDFEKAKEVVDPFLVRMNDANKQLADGIANDVGNAITKWQGFGALLSSIGDTMLKIATQTLITAPFKSFLEGAFSSSSGGIFGAIAGMFGGGRAVGGAVESGTTYLVGEMGPELFTPTSGGQITPNHALGGGGGGAPVTFIINNTIGDVASKSDVVAGMQTVQAQISQSLWRSKQYAGAMAS
jgi:phage-related minor tail protein